MDSDYGIEREISDSQKLRYTYQTPLPQCIQGTSVRVECGDATTAADPCDAETIGRMFPHTYGQPLVQFLSDSADLPCSSSSSAHNITPIRVGVVFCGRQSPGGHNVVWGIHNALKTHNPNSVLLGFLGGSEGLFAQKTLEITDDILSTYKNQGGYDLLGRTKDQIRTTEQVNAAMDACKSLKLDGLVIIGGVTSNTDAAQLAETFVEAKCPTKVVGVPVTLNGDLMNQFVETNVGFDTICKVNSQLISNICTDALSAEKYYYFIRLMGCKASHVALECTLQSHPNMVILGEDVSASKLTLSDLTKQICDAVQSRAEQDKYHGVILLPEGLIESIPEVYSLLQEIHGLLEQGVSVDTIPSQLSPSVSALFEFLPPFLRKQLLLLPESDDSAQLSQIETEKLLAHLVEIEMNERLKEGTYKGKKFNAICHFFGYQARGSLPSKFDCDYAFVLGHVCYHILVAGLTGYLATVKNLKNPVDKWRCGAAPITAMMTVKSFGHGPGASSPGKPALHPATVDLKGKAYELLRQNATKFLMDDVYRNLGPLQFDGPGADSKSATLCVEDQDCMGLIKEEEVVVDQVTSETSPPSVLEVAEAPPAAAAESGDNPQSPNQEEANNLETMTVLESREEDKLPDAVEYVLVNSKDSFPNSKPEELEEASVTKDSSECQISKGGNLYCPVNNGAEVEVKVAKAFNEVNEISNTEACRHPLAAGVLIPGNSKDSFPTSKPEEQEEASVTKDPSDCHINEGGHIFCPVSTCTEVEVKVEVTKASNVVNEISNTEACSHPLATGIVIAVDSKDSSPTFKPEEQEEASVTKDPSDCQINEGGYLYCPVTNGTEVEVKVEVTKASNVVNEISNTEACSHPLATGIVIAVDSKDSSPTFKPEEQEEASVTKDPSDCQINVGCNLYCPVNNGVEVEVEVTKASNEVNEISNTEACSHPLAAGIVIAVDSKDSFPTFKPEEQEEASVTIDPSDCQINEGGNLYCSVNNIAEVEVEVTEASNEVNEISNTEACSHPLATGIVIPVDGKDSFPTSKPEEQEEALVTKDPSDCQINEGGHLFCPVNNGTEVEVEVTKASYNVNEISNNVNEISNTEACSHPLTAGVVIPVVSCHVNGGLVHDVARSSVADMISDSEIHNFSSTNGTSISCSDVAVISQSPVQFGSFVPAIYQGNGVCGDGSDKIACQEVNNFEQVCKGGVSNPPPSPDGVSAHPEAKQDVAVEVESVERPFNFLIRMPRYYDDELNEQFKLAELQVAEKTQKREDINFKINVIKENLQQARSDYTAKLSEERAARRLVRLKRQKIDDVQKIINRVKNAISVEDIDTRIKHMEHMMQHETLPLKEEKQFIREIKQLKLYREQLSSNMGSEDEVRKAIDERDQIEEQLKIFKKDLDRLKHNVSTAEAAAVAADTKLKEEKKRLEELYVQRGAAHNIRQEAYMNLQNLRSQFYEKNARFRTYKDDTAAASTYASSRDKGALHRLCLDQVEKMMELWNNDDEFRKEYIRCNTRSTMWRLRTMDGRALGPDEELPVVTSFVNERIKSSRFRVGQVNPELSLVSADLDKMEEPLSTAEAAEITERKSVGKVAEQTSKADKAKKSANSAMGNNSPSINNLVETVETLEEVSNKKQTKEEQELARKEEQSRKVEEEAKLKEQRRLDEIAKAKEALERKRKIAEKAQIRAEVRAQKEAEQKDKEKEKRAKKKERKKVGAGGDEEGDIITLASDLTVVTTTKEAETKEVHPSAAGAATASKRPQKAFSKQHNRIKTAASLPPPLRNKNKRKWQTWIWGAVATMFVIAVVLLANMGLYSNNVGHHRYPGF